MEKDQFVIKHGDKWAVVGPNNEQAIQIWKRRQLI